MLPDDIPTEITQLVYTAPPISKQNKIALSQDEVAEQLAHYWPAIEGHVRRQVLREAAQIANVEGDRLYDDVGLKAAEGAWVVRDKLRKTADQ